MEPDSLIGQERSSQFFSSLKSDPGDRVQSKKEIFVVKVLTAKLAFGAALLDSLGTI